MRHRNYFAFGLALSLGHALGAGAGVASADTLTILNPTPDTGEYFGRSVAAFGGNVLIGAFRDDLGADEAGAAYLYDSATGALIRTFQNPMPAFQDNFGVSVAAAGGNVLVGAFQDDTGAVDSGAAYLFDGATGALLHTLLNPEPAAGDKFGVSVASAGGRVLVGAYGDDTQTTDSGAAYIFDASTGALLHTVLNPVPGAFNNFGNTAATFGEDFLVGAIKDDTGASNTGVVHQIDGATGALVRTFANPVPFTGDLFGGAIAQVGGNIAISARGSDTGALDSGAVYLFDGDTGLLLQTILNPTPDAGDLFGVSVAAMGGNILVGATNDDAWGSNAGIAYLFDGVTGALLHTYQSPSPAAESLFGNYLASAGGRVFVGAYGVDAGAENAGAVYVFHEVPEPGTFALLAAGLAGLGVRPRRRG